MESSSCCDTKPKKKGWRSGLFFGLIPHSFCILFIALSVVGATSATAFTKQFLLIPYFFQILLFISIVFAILSAMIYLKKTGKFSWQGVKQKKTYLASMIGTTVAVNLLVIYVLFPLSANMQTATASSQTLAGETLALDVAIPCSGHAQLIMEEIKKDAGVQVVMYQQPSHFVVRYDPDKTSPKQIQSLEIFQSFNLIK